MIVLDLITMILVLALGEAYIAIIGGASFVKFGLVPMLYSAS